MKYVIIKSGMRNEINATFEKEEVLDECVLQILNEIPDDRYRLYATKISESGRREYVYEISHGYYRRKNTSTSAFMDSSYGWKYKDGRKVTPNAFKEIRKQWQ